MLPVFVLVLPVKTVVTSGTIYEELYKIYVSYLFLSKEQLIHGVRMNFTHETFSLLKQNASHLHIN